MDHNGPKRNETKRTKTDRNGPEGTGVDRNGSKRTGTDRNRPDAALADATLYMVFRANTKIQINGDRRGRDRDKTFG